MLYQQVVNFMEHKLGLPIPPQMRLVPILAVDLYSLNENLSMSGAIGSHAINNLNPTEGPQQSASYVRGLTISRTGQIKHISAGSLGFNVRTGGLASHFTPSVLTITAVTEVSAVMVLHGLPSDLTAAILAHEAMHVWLKLTPNHSSNLSSKLEEGICQVVAHKYLDVLTAEQFDRPQNALKDEDFIKLKEQEGLRSYFRHQIETDRSTVYGDGYREAVKCVQAVGLDIVLEYIRDQQALPSV